MDEKNTKRDEKTQADWEEPGEPLWRGEHGAEDELAALSEVHYFFLQTMEAIFDSYETQMSMDWKIFHSGFTQLKEWMIYREKRALQLVSNELADARRSDTANDWFFSQKSPEEEQEEITLRPVETGCGQNSALLMSLIDKFNQITALNQFGDEATIALLSNEYDVGSQTRFGMNEFYLWVRENEKK